MSTARGDGTFLRIRNAFATVDAVLHRRADRPSPVVVVTTHPRSQSSLTTYPAGALAERGIDVLACNNRYTNSPAGTDLATVFEDLALDVAAAVQGARELGYRRVVLHGWSAGGPVMAFYQHLAERGPAAISPAALSGFAGFRDAALPPADGLILRSVTIGTAASFLFRLDGSVVDETTGERDPALDPYEPVNGYDPSNGSARYEPAFLRRYHAAQARRMNRLVERTLELRASIRAGRSRFADDDFVVIPGTRANPVTADTSLAAVTTGAAQALPSGRHGPVRDVRPIQSEADANRSARGAAVHTVRSLLSYRLVRVDEHRFDPLAHTSAGTGIDVTSTNNGTAVHLAGISVPLLVIQGSGDESNSVKLPSAELLHAASGSPDRSLVFVEGGNHAMEPVDDRFGDTRAVAADAMAGWLSERAG